MRTPRSRFARALVSALTLSAAAHALAACGTDRSARIQYMHPSPLSRWGNRIHVEPFENEGASGISRRVEFVVRQSGAFRMVDDGAQMAVVGEVHENTIGNETLSQRPFTCTRMVPELRTRQVPVVIPGVNPRVELRTEQYTEMVPQPYPCTQLVRAVDARFSMHVRINARTRPIHVVFERRYDLADQIESTGIAGSQGEDHPPAPLDGNALLRRLQDEAVRRFAQDALPTVDSTEVEFADCGDARCDEGIRLVRANDLAGAERTFSEVITAFERAQDPASRRKYAAALYNRGVVRGYAGQLDEGIDDLRIATTADATHPAWNQCLVTLQELQGEIEAARFRGETTSTSGGAVTPQRTPPRGGGRRGH